MKTRKFGILASLAIVLTTWTLAAQEGPAKAQVGDWTSMKMSVKGLEITMKQTVIAKDETTATIKMEQSFGGMTLPAQEQKISLSQLGDPTKLAAKAEEAKVEKLKTGKETLTIKGNKVNCDWMEVKTTANAGGNMITTIAKIWTSREVPLYGLVKMESDVMGQKVTMELVDYGRGK